MVVNVNGDEFFPEDLNDVNRCRRRVGDHCVLKPSGFWARLLGRSRCDYDHGCVDFLRPLSHDVTPEATADARRRMRLAIANAERGSGRAVVLYDIKECVFDAIKDEFIADGYHVYFSMGFVAIRLKSYGR